MGAGVWVSWCPQASPGSLLLPWTYVGPVAGPELRQSPLQVSAGPQPRGVGLGRFWPGPRLPGPVSEPQCARLEVGIEVEPLTGCREAGAHPWGAPERRPFAVCLRSLDVWIGFSAVEGAAAGPAPQGGAFSLESCQNWLPGEPHPATAERCVRLGPAGQCNTDLCSAPHSYVCELRPGGPVWDAENFLVGAPNGDLQGPLSPLEQQEALLAPQEPVEVGGPFGLLASRKQEDWDWPRGPVAGTARSQCTGPGLIPGRGTRSCRPQGGLIPRAQKRHGAAK